MSEQYVVIPYVVAYITRQTDRGVEVLLTYRSATGFPVNTYAMPGGKIDENESPTQAVMRETEEEVGIIADPHSMKLATTLYFKGHTETCIAFVFSIASWKGEVENREPAKHSHIKWFLLDYLPSDLFPRHILIINNIKKHLAYDEEGF
jgi:mutator protein MutT